MKCWKCGSEIPESASVCTYCSASMIRKPPMTEPGRAMRQIYDRFGYRSVFDKRSVLLPALGDILEDSKKLRDQLGMVLSAGVGNVYANQLQNSGKPDDAFYSKVRILITEEAGLSDKVATELIGYFDEMIGWSKPVRTAPPSGGSSSHGSTSHGSSSRGHGVTPPPHKPPVDRNPPPSPPPVKPPVTEKIIPLPTRPVPNKMGCGALLGQLLSIGLAVAAGITAIKTLVSGAWPAAIGAGLLAWFFAKIVDVLENPSSEKKITCTRKDAVLEMTWEGAIDKFAVAVGDKWVLTGSGNKVFLRGDLFTQYKPGEKIHVTLAEITAAGVEFRGQVYLQHPKK